jgi:hypothetical protein
MLPHTEAGTGCTRRDGVLEGLPGGNRNRGVGRKHSLTLRIRDYRNGELLESPRRAPGSIIRPTPASDRGFLGCKRPVVSSEWWEADGRDAGVPNNRDLTFHLQKGDIEIISKNWSLGLALRLALD